MGRRSILPPIGIIAYIDPVSGQLCIVNHRNNAKPIFPKQKRRKFNNQQEQPVTPVQPIDVPDVNAVGQIAASFEPDEIIELLYPDFTDEVPDPFDLSNCL